MPMPAGRISLSGNIARQHRWQLAVDECAQPRNSLPNEKHREKSQAGGNAFIQCPAQELRRRLRGADENKRF